MWGLSGNLLEVQGWADKLGTWQAAGSERAAVNERRSSEAMRYCISCSLSFVTVEDDFNTKVFRFS